jgi:hypothetical protein
MTPLEQQMNGFDLGKDYPHPIIDLVAAGKKPDKKYGDTAKMIWLNKKETNIANTHPKQLDYVFKQNRYREHAKSRAIKTHQLY